MVRPGAAAKSDGRIAGKGISLQGPRRRPPAAPLDRIDNPQASRNPRLSNQERDEPEERCRTSAACRTPRPFRTTAGTARRAPLPHEQAHPHGNFWNRVEHPPDRDHLRPLSAAQQAVSAVAGFHKQARAGAEVGAEERAAMAGSAPGLRSRPFVIPACTAGRPRQGEGRVPRGRQPRGWSRDRETS